MEDGISWKDHSFTLLIFTGIVVLCSIFFILGMLVGRAQGQKMASLVLTGAAAKSELKADAAVAKEENQDLTFFDSVRKDKQPALVPPPSEPLPPAASSELPVRSQAINLQVAAVRKSSDADK